MAEFKAKSAAEVVEAVLDEIMEDAGVLVSQCRNARSTMESRAQDKAAARKKIAYRLKPLAAQANVIEAQARRIEELEAAMQPDGYLAAIGAVLDPDAEYHQSDIIIRGRGCSHGDAIGKMYHARMALGSLRALLSTPGAS